MKGIVRNVFRNTLIVAGLAGAASAFAGADHYNTATIRYSAEQLESEAGRAAVYRELKLAVKAVCGPTNLRKAGSLYEKMRNETCVEEKLDEMIDKIGHRELTTLHRDTSAVHG